VSGRDPDRPGRHPEAAQDRQLDRLHVKRGIRRPAMAGTRRGKLPSAGSSAVSFLGPATGNAPFFASPGPGLP
jgi:hypothetical protein